MPVNKIDIKACANCDHAMVAWRPQRKIENCLGFALIRRAKGGKDTALETFVGPNTEKNVPAGTHRPSTVWPIQKFTWADYHAPSGEQVSYRAVPMIGKTFDAMKQDTDGASAWSNVVSLLPPPDVPVQGFFNRGVVSTQFVARSLAAEKGKSLLQLVDPAKGTTKLRDFLGGVLKEQFLALLADRNKAGCHIYASLFELNDPQVLPAIAAFGTRAHVILADGTHTVPKERPAGKGNKVAKPNKATVAKSKGKKPPDENAAARKRLHAAHVDVHDRMVTGQHFSHHKFIVFCDPKDPKQAASVWTGSTNLTYGGVCTQANNGLLIRNATIAGRFLEQWWELAKDGADYPESLVDLGAHPKSTDVGDGVKVTAWFSPNPKISGPKPKGSDGNKYGDHADLKAARTLIQNAKEGVLFLVFNPGYNGTLLNDILDLANGPKGKTLFIHGVANQDPIGGKNKQPLIFVNRGKPQRASADVVLPGNVGVSKSLADKDKKAAKALADWVKLISNYWRQEKTGLGMVRVHSKVIVVDPFGKHPVVITGSHNLGPKASAVNDDNMVIIEYDSGLAGAYAVNIATVFDQYRWRFLQQKAARAHKPLNQWRGLTAPWTDQPNYFKDAKKKELDFWL